MQPAATLRVLVDVQATKAARDLGKFDSRLQSSAKQASAAGTKYDSAAESLTKTGEAAEGTAKSVDKSAKSFVSSSKSMKTFAGDSDRLTNVFDRLDGRISRVHTSTGRLGAVIESVKIEGIIAGGGLLAESLATAAGGAVALTGALKPLVGLLTQYGTALTTALQVKGVTAVAQLSEITDVVGGLNEKLDQGSKEFKKLSPEAQKFAKTLNQAKAPLREIQDAVREPLLEGLTKGLHEAMDNLPALEKILTGTADVMGKLAEQAGKFIGSKGFGRDFAKIAETNEHVLSRFGRSGINLAHALTDVLVAARPLTEWISKLALSWSKATKESAAQGRETGKLRDFFEQTKEVAGDLIAIFGNVAGALGNITKLGAPLGREIIDKLRIGARQLREWTESVEGKHAIKDFFEEIREPLFQAGKLLGAFVETFFAIHHHTAGQLAPLLKSLRKDLLPVLQEVIEHTAHAFGQRLIDLLIALAQAFGDIAGTNGPLNIWVDTLTAMLRGFDWMIKNIPGFQTLITTLLGFKAVSSAFAALAGISGLTSFVSFLKFLVLPGTIAGLAAASPALTGLATSMGVLEVSAAGLSVAVGALVTATGIGALVVVAVLIATHWEETKKVLAAVWGWIEDHALLLGAIFAPFTGGLSLLVALVAKNWDKIKSVLSDVWGWMKGAAKDTAEFVSGVWNKIKGPLTAIWKVIKGAAKVAWSVIKTGAKALFEWFKVATLPVRLAFKAAWFVISNGAKIAWEIIKRVFETGWGVIKDVAGFIVDRFNNLKDFFGGLAEKIGGAMSDVANAIASPFKDAFSAVVDAARFMLDKLLGGFSTAIGALADIIGSIPEISIFGEQITPDFSGIADDLRGTQTSIDDFRENLRGTDESVGKSGKDIRKTFTTNAEVIDESTRRASDSVGGFRRSSNKDHKDAADTAARETKRGARAVDENTGDAERKGTKHAKDLADHAGGHYQSLASIAGTSTKKTAKDTDRDMGDAERTGTKHADDLKKGAGGSYRSLSSIVHDALFKVQDNTSKALKALGLDPISFGLGLSTGATAEAVGEGSNSGGGGGGGRRDRRQGGGVIAGIGSGDKVPILGEPGEVMLNREAVAAMGGPDRVNLLNRIFPRFGKLRMQPGGIVGIPSFPGEFIDRRILPDVERLTQSYKQFVSDGYAPTGHAASGEHPLGLATDLVPWTARGGTWDDTDRLAHFAEPVQNQPVDPFRWVGYNGDVAHGRGDHLHLSWQHGPGFPAEWVKTLGGRAIGAVDADVRRVLIKGPDGPLRSIAQAAVDKVRDAARRMVRRKSQTAVGDLPMGGAVTNLPSGVLSRNDIRQLLGAHGMPDIMGYTAYAESGFDPNAGNGSYEGLWALGSPFWTQFAPPGAGDWASNVHDPNLNAATASRGHASLGMQPWEASRNAGAGGGWGQYVGQPFQRGGIVRMQGGGIVGKGGSGGTSAGGGGGGHGHRPHRPHRNRGGGKGNLFSFSLDAFLGRMLSLKSADRRKETIDRALRLIRSADGSGLTADGSELGGPLADLLAKADEFADYAGRAASLDDPDHPNTFRVRGKTTGGWLTDELDVLWTLRNRLLDAQAVIQKQRKRLLKLIHQASRRLRQAQRRVAQIKKQLEKPGKTPKNWKGPNPAKDTVDAWNRIKDKERAKQGAKFLRQGGVLPGDRQFRDDFSIATPESQPLAFPNIKGVRHQIAGLKALAPALATQRGVVDTGHGTLRDMLSEVQGFGPHDRKLKLSESELGVFGGRILDVQIALRDLNVKPEASDTGEGRDALTIAALREFAEAVELGAFRGASFMGAFAGGGVALVGEKGPELAHMPSGTRIHSATDTEQMMNPNITLFADIYIGGEKVEEKVEVKLRDQDRREFTAARAGRRRGL